MEKYKVKRMKWNFLKAFRMLLPITLFVVLLLTLLISLATTFFSEINKQALIEVFSDEQILHVILFTIKQALISTVATIIIAIPIARAIHRRKFFFGRSIIIKVISLSFVVPSVVLVLGLAEIHGTNGWINKFLALFNLSFKQYLYGFSGIILGHITFNIPIAVRIFLNKLDAIPDDTWKLATNLGFSSYRIFKNIEKPILKIAITQVFTIIFIISFTSFVIVLDLGANPANTSMEVAIYQALRFEFDISKAVILCVLQFVICLILMLFVSRGQYSPIFLKTTYNIHFHRPDLKNKFEIMIDYFFILLTCIIIILPIIAIGKAGFNSGLLRLFYNEEFWKAFGYSIFIALSSGILSIIFAASIMSGVFYFKYIQKNNTMLRITSLISNFTIILSPYIIGTGLFIIFKPSINLFFVGKYILILINALLVLPFVISILINPIISFPIKKIWLCRNLNIKSYDFFRLIIWREIRKYVAYALSIAITLSWGDFSIIALFGNEDFITLPYLLNYNMSNYNTSDAANISFVMLFLAFLLIWIVEEFIGGAENVKIK